ncbi:MAG: cold shock domain-containing protein [Methyloprofundus sp.]|nr:cold shock domain-containing protein [Methyloprofundus sp.]MBW6453506.1 cold shock domain-containing protein [Methyloprofundus sp.]
MATQTETGTIAAWKDDRGFGFIRTKSDNKEDDVFIHISSLNNMSRRPRIGDVIHYDLTEENGKTKAINAIIEGVEPFSDGANANILMIIVVTAVISSALTAIVMKFVL